MVTLAAGHLRVGFIVGPTAAGKSAVALRIAEQLGGEIINADSRQIYRGMDIGTAKPRADELSRVPHHLIDIRHPDAPLNAAEFARMARTAIGEVAARGRPVLVVGGSGLYLRAIRDGIFPAPPASAAVRAGLTSLADRHGLGRLFERLSAIDPPAAARINRNDFKRIVRALEVHELTGLSITEHQRRHQFADHPFTTLTVGLTLPRENLYRTIDRRFDAMIEQGLVGEVRRLLEKVSPAAALASADAGEREVPNPAAVPLSTIGYREIALFVRGELSLAEAIARAKRASRRLAKRQLTWFRAVPEIIWLDAEHDFHAALTLFQRFFFDQVGDGPPSSAPLAGC